MPAAMAFGWFTAALRAVPHARLCTMRNDLINVRTAITVAARPIPRVIQRPLAAVWPTVCIVETSVSDRSSWELADRCVPLADMKPRPATRTRSNGTRRRNRRNAIAPASMPPAMRESFS